MPRGRKTALTICLTPAERETLQAWQGATTIRAGLARRGRIILLVAEGQSISAVAKTVGVNRRFIYKWVEWFQEGRVEGLHDKPGRGFQAPRWQAVQATPDPQDIAAYGFQATGTC